MPTISKIRITNVVYEGGNKRYNDEIFQFDGHNAAILLENGGGKTVFIQTALQAVLPHADLAGRKIKETFSLENGPAHIAIEWILHDRPRRYAVTCVTLFMTSSGVDSIRYVYDYPAHDPDELETIPFVKQASKKLRPAEKGEIQDYYQSMCNKRLNAHVFPTIKGFHQYLEEQLQIVSTEWEWIAKINQSEGGIEHFFDECKTTKQLFERLLIPVVEASISGYTDGQFAATFQTHLDGFKKYKELKEKVEENKRILSELDGYVQVFRSLHERQLSYSSIQSKAKAYWQVAHKRKESQSATLLQLDEQIRQWGSKMDGLQEKKDSLDIARQKQGLDEIRQKLELADAKRQSVFKESNSTEQQYYSLQYADYHAQYVAANEQVRMAQEKLEQLEKTNDERELEGAWIRNSGQIRFLFNVEEEKYTAELLQLEQSKNALQSQLLTCEKQLRQLETEFRGFEDKTIKLVTSEEEKEQQREDIRMQVLDNPALEDVEDKLEFWIKRLNELDESIISLTKQNKELSRQKSESEKESERLQAAIREESAVRSRIETELCQQQKAHDFVLSNFKELHPTWERLQSVYERQSSIEQQLVEDLDKLYRDKERLLQQERLAFRFVDDYSGQDCFFAEPLLSELQSKWASQFTVLKTGTEYLEDIGITDENFPHSLWAVTLVTIEKEKQVLLEKLTGYKQQLQYPIHVITTDEASLLIQGESLSQLGVWVEPWHWLSNMNQDTFRAWKEALVQSANSSREEREQQEKKVKRWENMNQELLRYLDEYPLEKAQEMEWDLANVKEKLGRLEQEAIQLKNTIWQVSAQSSENQNKISNYKDELHVLNSRIEKGHKYRMLGKEIQGLHAEIEQSRERMKAYQHEIHRHQFELTRLQNEEKHLTDAYQRATYERQSLRNLDLFHEVRDFSPIPTESILERLKMEHSELALRRQHISQTRKEIELELKSALDKQNWTNNEMRRLMSEHPNLNRETEFPRHGKLLLDELLARIQVQKKEIQQLTDEYNRVDREFAGMNREVKILIKSYMTKHQDEHPVVFIEPLSVISDQILLDEKTLAIEKRELDRMGEQLRSQLESIQNAIQELTQYKLMHGFEDPAVSPVELTSKDLSDFSYHIRQFVEEITVKLDSSFKAVENEVNRQKTARDLFKVFCRKQIKDVKLREMAEQGVDSADKFDKIVSFQQLMQNRIRRVNDIAEETMRTHNQELEQFIVHVHSHLKLVTTELKDIPSKTRVKVDNDWKAIYSFNVPEWEEQEGKGAIRAYLGWILEQLEKDKYIDEQGQEHVTVMKNDLEKWLETKQLLQVILQDKPMKVSCRKVTNENTLTKAAYSWEQSNNWSGGEKWSKNMTLFLGLLNYTAEKRQHIRSDMKRHRTVILDNPFGKASSEHVLTPVFFIAEQLGFQMIALTAHATGKFLQDYFPIVYSCKLRQASGNNKQVMTKEQMINKAYFRDHDPVAIERLGQFTQVELF